MDLELQFVEDDFLKYQLYAASKSERIIKKRRKNLILVSTFMFSLSLLFLISEREMLFYYFLVFGIITLIFYPKYERRKYRNHYSKFIKENYTGKIGLLEKIKMSENFIENRSKIGSGKINTKSIQKIVELESHIFINLETGDSLIFPKREINQIDELKRYLRGLSDKLGVEYKVDLNWKWK